VPEDACTAEPFVPAHADLAALREAAAGCRGCPLHRDATRTVFGAGNGDARIMLVGEQPGDQEDRQGRPFVGPAGRLLDRALEEAGIDRDLVYVTNAVKHFRFTQTGRRRLHQTPGPEHIEACRPWLVAEFALLNPEVVVILGATALKALLGGEYRVTRDRGRLLPFPVPTNAEETATHHTHAVITTHPSAILRTPSEVREQARVAFVNDLKVAASVLAR